jgi:hypothetical protein
MTAESEGLIGAMRFARIFSDFSSKEVLESKSSDVGFIHGWH